jgi:oligopeptidase B
METAPIEHPAGAASSEPPKAEERETVAIVHGDRRVDPYSWLRDKADPKVKTYLEAENAYADSWMGRTRQLQETLYREMLARIKETDLSVPVKDGAYLYYYRTEEGKQYPIYCRKPASGEDREQITLDLNVLAEGHPFMALGTLTVNDDGSLLAYSTDETGFRQYTLVVKDLSFGTLLPLRIERVTSAAWASGRTHLFVTVEDDAKRSYRLFRVSLESGAQELVYEEKDERFNISVGRTRSRAFLLLGSGSHTASEVRVLPADRPLESFRLVIERRENHEYDLDHRDDRFFIRTNDRGRNFRLVAAPVATPGEASWTEIVPHRADVMLEGIDLFAHHMVLSERRDGLPRFRILDFDKAEFHEMAFDEAVYSAWPGANAEWETRLFRYGYESFVTPQSVYDYDMEQRRSTLLKRTEVRGGYDQSLYESRRIYAVAQDGTRVPISLVFRKDAKRLALHLYGYGSYGIPIPAGFSSNRVSLLDRGVAFAIAHIRGGGELGKAWHDQGRMMSKRNTFTDFIAAAEQLLASGEVPAGHLTVEGGSAGGLLMGAVSNMRGGLFRAVLSKVPFVDVVNTMLDPSLPLTVGEYEEWGDPRNRAEYDYIKSYCPYTNLEAKGYPSMLVKTAFNDSQVMYWEPAKYVARLRGLKTDQNPLLLKTNMAAGHGGASGRYDFLREVAYDYAFLLEALELTQPK